MIIKSLNALAPVTANFDSIKILLYIIMQVCVTEQVDVEHVVEMDPRARGLGFDSCCAFHV